jgi:hypothetical protein
VAADGLTVNPAELVACARSMVLGASQFGGLADSLSQGPAYGVATGTDFGKLPASARLAGLTAQINDAANQEFTAAGTVLRGTEYALDQTLQNYIEADGSAAAAAMAAAAPIIHLEQEGTIP